MYGDVKDLLQRKVNLKQLLGLLENEEEQREGGMATLSHMSGKPSCH